MSLKTLALAGATILSLAAPAVALAEPWDHDRGYHEGWRGHEWREHERWEHRGYAWGYAPRCWVENRGYRTWYGDYVYRPIRVCR